MIRDFLMGWPAALDAIDEPAGLRARPGPPKTPPAPVGPPTNPKLQALRKSLDDAWLASFSSSPGGQPDRGKPSRRPFRAPAG